MPHRENQTGGHRETLENIPWLVTGRLDSVATAEAQAHLKTCPACQSEFDFQCSLQARIAEAPSIDHAPAASRAKLETRIAELERELPIAGSVGTPDVRPPVADRMSVAGLGRTITPTRRWARRPLVLAQSAAIVLLALLAVWTSVERWAAPRYATATSTIPPRVAGAAVRVVLAPEVGEREFEALLLAQGARVIDGPTPEHAWTIELPAARGSVAALRADPRVALAEPITAAGSP